MSGPRMSEVIVPKAFTTLPPDADKRTVIRLLSNALATARKIKATQVDEIVEQAMARESVGSTGIGHGIAIPHCRTEHVKTISCAFGMCPEGVEFDSLDGEPVNSVFLLLTPPDKKDDHLALMKNFAGQIRKEHFTDFLRQTRDPEALVELLSEFENK